MDIALIIAIVIGLIVIGAVFLIVIGLRYSRDTDPLEDRLAEYASRGETASLEEIELSQTFSERVIFPLARGFGEVALRFTPQNAVENTRRRLEQAGNPRGLDPTIFWALRFLGLGAGILMAGISFVAPEGSFLKGSTALFIAVFVSVLGFFLPELWLRSIIERRRKQILKALPDALDLLTICVEAGLGFDMAMDRVQSKWENELSLIFARVLREMQLGKLRRDALKDMASRVNLTELSSFVAAVVQSEQLGVSMSNVLRVQSDAMRVKRRQLAEEEAQKAPIKMLFPMAFLIFPSLLIILLGPAALILMTSALGGILF
ncbi:MAG TPA: type II secretion system F family protein [Anaerolineales bacterium]|nr:type II secretion system F family protein [Anaerolineales bacterium]